MAQFKKMCPFKVGDIVVFDQSPNVTLYSTSRVDLCHVREVPHNLSEDRNWILDEGKEMTLLVRHVVTIANLRKMEINQCVEWNLNDRKKFETNEEYNEYLTKQWNKQYNSLITEELLRAIQEMFDKKRTLQDNARTIIMAASLTSQSNSDVFDAVFFTNILTRVNSFAFYQQNELLKRINPEWAIVMGWLRD